MRARDASRMCTSGEKRFRAEVVGEKITRKTDASVSRETASFHERCGLRFKINIRLYPEDVLARKAHRCRISNLTQEFFILQQVLFPGETPAFVTIFQYLTFVFFFLDDIIVHKYSPPLSHALKEKNKANIFSNVSETIGYRA